MRSLLVAGLLLSAAPALAPARDVPALTGPVVDEAGILGPGDQRRLEALARAAWEQPAEHRVQLQYLLVRSLDGEDVEGFAVRVFQAWKLGEKGKDNGILLVVSQGDRKIRIETGYGNEGALTDAQAGRIIRGTVAPAFREGRYGDGLYQAGVQILSALGALPQGTARQIARPAPLHGLSTLAIIALVVFFLFARVLSGFGPRRRRFLGGGWGPFGGWGGGGWSGGGWGGGGGGWGGGGGRSGGGGASGGW